MAGLDLCAGCHAELPRLGHCCLRCAQPLTGTTETLCSACQHRPPPYERCRVAFRYLEPLPYLISGMKFHGRLEWSRLLGELLAAALSAHSDWQRPERIIPVPLHPRRLRQRGYNQALEIARVLARHWSLVIDPHCCQRCRPTPPQVGLSRSARAHNLRGAFRATRALSGARLAILDDVITTGATVAELTSVLQAAGAARVEAWAVARTVNNTAPGPLQPLNPFLR